MAGISIKDAPLVEEIKEDIKIPVSDGSNSARAILLKQVWSFITKGLSKVAISGSYKDLKDTPGVGDIVTEETITDWGFTKNKGTYIKPESGIPYADLEQRVQKSLNKADSALQKHQDISHLATEDEVNNGLALKQDTIEDLYQIRQNASKGATAIQIIPSEYITETKLQEKDYATNEKLNNKVDKVEGKQLSTEDFTTLLKQKLEGLSNYDDSEIVAAFNQIRTEFDALVGGNASAAINSFNEIIAFLEGIEDSQKLDSIIASIEQQIAGKMDKVTLATVATSGSYDDLSNKPTIPSEVTESTVSGWGFTKNTGDYSKPSTGIPKTDLADEVRTSLGKADTALQSYTEQYKGTVTGVKINGTTKNPSSGIVDLGTVITDISGKADKSVVGAFYKGDWTAAEAVGISKKLTETLVLPAGVYVVNMVCPYCSDMSMEICIGFSAKMAIGSGNTFIKACYGTVTMLAKFEGTTNLHILTAASNTDAKWSYLDRGGIAAIRIA